MFIVFKTFLMNNSISIFLALIIFLFSGCTKKDTDNNSVSKPTQAMFWVDSDLGCGNITITCNGISKTISGYYHTQPDCGASGAATFDLDAGIYDFTAQCASKNWSGTITVQGGRCNSFKLNSAGGGATGGGGDNNPPTVTAPSTQFIASQDYTVSNNGAYWTQQFTLSQTTSFVFRFASQYQAQAAIILPGQISGFQNNQSFSGYATFDKTLGTHNVTLNAGTYYVAIRNASAGANKWSMELDYATSLPSSDKATFLDNYASGAKSFASAGKFWQPFTVQNGYRYFIDGCNVNCDVKIIPADQLAAFQSGQTFQYYTDYSDGTGAAPGLWEISLPVGDYYLIASNTTTAALTYILERWKVN